MDIKSVIMSNLLEHANYLNAVLESPKTPCLTWVPRQQMMHILTIKLLFTLTLASHYRTTKTLFQKQNTEQQ